MWGSVSQVRLITGLSDTEVTDTDINNYLSLATDEIWSTIYILVIRDKPNQYDGYWYKLSYNFIGDYDKDGDISTDDVTVYTEGDNPDERTTVTVTDIDADLGLVKLSSKTFSDTLYATYCHSFKKLDFNLINLATSLLASKYIILNKVLLKPISFKLGTMRISYGSRTEYTSLINIENKLAEILEFLTNSSLSSNYSLDFYNGVSNDII